jgi:hypothetical protein
VDDLTAKNPPDDYAVHDDLVEGWWVWQSPENKLWHARLRGSQPPVLVHGNNLEDLRESVRQAS